MLSITAICKNERSNIQGFIASWSPIADEIVIVDTGSGDGTLGLLRAIELTNTKLRVYTREWNGFSDARNYASSLALGTWILWADMDDRLDTESIGRIKEIVRYPSQTCVYGFQVASDVGNGDWHRFMQIRLFPNLPSMLFRKKVHENLEQSIVINGMTVVQEPEIIVAHIGYADPDERNKKAVRNLHILLENSEHDAAEHAQIGDALYTLGKYSVGLGYFEEACRMGGALAKKNLAEKLLVGYLKTGMLEKAFEVAHGMEMHSVSRDYWMGEISRAKGEFHSSKLNFERALTGSRDLSMRECNGDTLIRLAKSRLKELEALCARA